jgi:hypothetical protein
MLRKINVVFVFISAVIVCCCFISTAQANRNISSATCYCQACAQPDPVRHYLCQGEVEPDIMPTVYCNDKGLFINEFKGGFNRCSRNSMVRIRGRETPVLKFCEMLCRQNSKEIDYRIDERTEKRKANVFKTIKYSDG